MKADIILPTRAPGYSSCRLSRTVCWSLTAVTSCSVNEPALSLAITSSSIASSSSGVCPARASAVTT